MPYRLRLQFESAEAFGREFERNLAMGGAFVPTGDPLQLGCVVEVEVAIADRDERVCLEAQVVHTVPPERALSPLEAGVVVAFRVPEDELRERLAPYLEVEAADAASAAAEAAPTPEDRPEPTSSSRYPAHARFQPRLQQIDSEQLTRLEASLIEMATVGLPASRMLEVIPEEPSEIEEALQSLVERGVLRVA